jgi:hypothetical protein
MLPVPAAPPLLVGAGALGKASLLVDDRPLSALQAASDKAQKQTNLPHRRTEIMTSMVASA